MKGHRDTEWTKKHDLNLFCLEKSTSPLRIPMDTKVTLCMNIARYSKHLESVGEAFAAKALGLELGPPGLI